jgi:AcrR family transcriptional regulator
LGRPDKPLISRERAAKAALDVIDTKGLNALSLELVARQLGVKAPSLYYHFKDKSELLNEVALSILRDVNLPPPDPNNWEQTLIDLCVATRRTIMLHPNAAPLLLEVFPRRIFPRAYEYWIGKCPYPAKYHMVILEGSEKITYGSALFAAASRSRGIAPMPDLDQRKFPALTKAVRANNNDEEALFIGVLKMFFAGVRATAEADSKSPAVRVD